MRRRAITISTPRRGSVLIIALAVLIVLTSLTLLLGRSMRVEASASANYVAQLQADSVARGAVEYVRSAIDGLDGQLPDDETLYAQAVPVGQGYFWLLKHDLADDRNSAFGLNDEAAKLNLNTATADMLALLPNMTPDLASAIIDWRDSDDDQLPGGAESQYYLLMPTPYQAKNGPFESVDELLLVKDVTPALLFGEDLNRNGLLDPNEDDGVQTEPMDNNDGKLDRGLADYVTALSIGKPLLLPRRPGRGGGPPTTTANFAPGLVNLNTAPREVLVCLPDLTDSDADAIISHRQGNTGFTNVSDLLSVLPDKASSIGPYVTTQTYRCMADILAVDATGRGFKRYQVVFDTQSSPATVVYIRDLTNLGWPLDRQILTDLRAGKAPVMGMGTAVLLAN